MSMLDRNKQKRETTASLSALNGASRGDYMRLIGDVVEHSPWVAEQTFSSRPFRSVEDLNTKLMDCIRRASETQMIDLFNLHPELAGQEAAAGVMTDSSTGEQGRLGLTRLLPEQQARLSRINREYRTKFGFPFIAALRLHDDLESVMNEGEATLGNSREEEIDRTLRQITAIVFGRLCRIFPPD